MFIYADESGHSGRYIFNEPTHYFQGAILSETDPEPLLHPLAEEYRQELGVERLHANELKPHTVESIASNCLIRLESTNWKFHLTEIEKPYLAVVKFVDTIFDSYENKGTRWLWYNQELFRHVLCCLFDKVLSEDKKKEFWQAYLRDDYDKVVSILEWTLDSLGDFEIDGRSIDRRLEEVARDGLVFALKYPMEITLMAGQTKKSYKGHTPNMVAFSSLIHAIHKFCEENDVVPEKFFHDPQSEFGPTMKKYHKIFSKVKTTTKSSGLLTSVERIDYGLGEFSLTPSRDLTCLQVVDLFIWLSQRSERIKSPGLRQSLMEKTDLFSISGRMSEMIAYAWLHKLSTAEFTDQQLRDGKEMAENMESDHKKKLREFESDN